MKLREVVLRRFKRFTDTTVTQRPEMARLYIIAGPNGCGKTSFFEALNSWQRQHQFGTNWNDSYYVKKLDDTETASSTVNLSFYDPQPSNLRKAVYIRSAYRNDPKFELKSIDKMGSMLDENRLPTLIENDAAVGNNYKRLASQALEDVFDLEADNTTIGQFREKVIGEIKAATTRLFPDLVMNSLGNPLTSGTFKFDKGKSKGFLYKNLSGGEKAAFDLLLDIIVKKKEYDDTIFCIDEPETHMNTRLQGALLRELYGAMGEQSQLWLATHSVGMMRAARDLAAEHPGTVVFLNFGDRDFDQSQTIAPEAPSRAFWQKVLSVGFDDFAALIAPAELILCEGAAENSGGRNAGIDAKIYDDIFGSEFPDTRFLASGSSSQVLADKLALVETMQAIVRGTRVRRLLDRDDMSNSAVIEMAAEGVAVLGRRHIESYLFDDEVLVLLATKNGQSEKAPELIAKKTAILLQAHEDAGRKRPLDDMKASAGQMMALLKTELSLQRAGGSLKDFMRTTLAPLITPDTGIYLELRRSVFPQTAAS